MVIVGTVEGRTKTVLVNYILLLLFFFMFYDNEIPFFVSGVNIASVSG